MGYFDIMNIIELTSGTCTGIIEQDAYQFEDLSHLSMDKLFETINMLFLMSV